MQLQKLEKDIEYYKSFEEKNKKLDKDNIELSEKNEKLNEKIITLESEKNKLEIQLQDSKGKDDLDILFGEEEKDSNEDEMKRELEIIKERLNSEEKQNKQLQEA